MIKIGCIEDDIFFLNDNATVFLGVLQTPDITRVVIGEMLED